MPSTRGCPQRGGNRGRLRGDLAQVIVAKGNAEYLDAARFFANTYPTRGLKNLLANVSRRLTGAGGEVASIFRLDTSYGGGKTHGLIALCHAARGMEGVPNISEFIDPSLLPACHVRIAAFDGENADPANGRSMGDVMSPDPNIYGYKRAFTYTPSEEDRDWAELIVGSALKGLSVLDPTAGGGSIPIESGRLGLTSIANDLNPVAALILRATVDWPVRCSHALSECPSGDFMSRMNRLSGAPS